MKWNRGAASCSARSALVVSRCGQQWRHEVVVARLLHPHKQRREASAPVRIARDVIMLYVTVGYNKQKQKENTVH